MKEINQGYQLLLSAIRSGDELRLSRLLRLGVDLSLRGSCSSPFWASMDALREFMEEGTDNDSPPTSGAFVRQNRSSETLSRKLILWYLGRDQHGSTAFPIEGTAPSDVSLLQQLACTKYDTYLNDHQYRDAIQAAALLKNEDSDTILRTILDYASETGWFHTRAGRESLELCKSMVLDRDDMYLFNLLQGYARASAATSADPHAPDLYTSLCNGDINNALLLTDIGERLDNKQLVEIWNNREWKAAHTFLRTTYPFSSNQLKAALTKLLCEGTRSRNSKLDIVTQVLERRQQLVGEETKRSWLLGWFDDATLKHSFKRIVPFTWSPPGFEQPAVSAQFRSQRSCPPQKCRRSQQACQARHQSLFAEVLRVFRRVFKVGDDDCLYRQLQIRFKLVGSDSAPGVPRLLLLASFSAHHRQQEFATDDRMRDFAPVHDSRGRKDFLHFARNCQGSEADDCEKRSRQEDGSSPRWGV